MVGLIPAKITIVVGQCCLPDDVCDGGDDDGDSCDTASTSDCPGGTCAAGAGDDVCQSDQLTENECNDKGGRFNGDKTCDDPCAECPDGTNAECADGDACTVDACNADFSCSHTKVAIGADDCCDDVPANATADVEGSGNVKTSDDDNECTDDSCSGVGNRGVPAHTSRTGQPCDDGEPCETVDDTCQADDSCVGTPIIEIPCVDDEECENAAVGCPEGSEPLCDASGFCFTERPSLGLDITSAKPPVVADDRNPKCFDQGQKVEVAVTFSNFPLVVQGAQFIVTYDPSCVRFNSVVPGGDPYTFQLASRVDQASGRIFYAVGVNPFGGKGISGAGVLARLSFVKLAGQFDCPNCIFDFDSVNPQNTIVAGQDGKAFKNVETEPSNEIHVNDRLSLDTPDNDKVNSLCDERGAVVTWDAPTASSSCADPHGCDPNKKKCYDVNLVCSGSGPKGPYPQAVVMNGGLLDQGRSQFCCTATGKICGNTKQGCWTVDVNDQVSLDITIQLQPIMAATTLTRCIEFQLYEDCIHEPMCFRQDVVFGGNNFIGKFSGKKKFRKAQWSCMTARDQSHSLESCSFLECREDGNFEAVFAGDPFFGGNWLIQGNLDEWQKGENTSADVIDILDFATFLIQFGMQMNPNTPCNPLANECPDPLDGPHCDINGDGVCDGTDFAFIFDNFLVAKKNCCCADATAGAPGLLEVSNVQLREMGLANLIVADLNRDGVVNMVDMNEFLAGKRPEAKGTSRTRRGSGIDSRR